MIRLTKATWRERWQLAVIELCAIADALVYLLSLTLLNGSLRQRALFVWFQDVGRPLVHYLLHGQPGLVKDAEAAVLLGDGVAEGRVADLHR
jgi:hypothetical protein